MIDLDEVLLIPPKFYPDILADQFGFKSTDLAWSKEFMAVLTGDLDLVDYLASFGPLSHLPREEIIDIAHNKWPQSDCVIDPRVYNYLLGLKDLGVKLVAATNNPSQKCRYVHEVLLPDFFDAFLTSSDLRCLKDDPQFFHKGMSELRAIDGLEDLRPEEVVFIDDNKNYVESASSIGIDGRLYSHPHQVRSLVSVLRFFKQPQLQN